MGFVGGGGNNNCTTSIIFCVLYCKHQMVYRISLSYLLCLREALVTDMRHVSEVLVPGFGRPVLLCLCKMPPARGTAAYVRDGYGAFCQPKFQCGVEKY